MQESQQFLRSSLDAMAGHIAVLDESGIILEVNESWRRFAGDNQYVGTACGVGSNYFHACQPVGDIEEREPLSNDETSDGKSVVEGICDVIAGRINTFEAQYACHSPSQQRWFLMRATRFPGPGPVRVVIVHDNITAQKRAEAARGALAEQFAEHSRTFDRLLSSLSPTSPIRSILTDASRSQTSGSSIYGD